MLGPNPRVKVAVMSLLTVLGIPFSVVYTVPFAATSRLALALAEALADWLRGNVTENFVVMKAEANCWESLLAY